MYVKNVDSRGRLSRLRHRQVVLEPHDFLSTRVTDKDIGDSKNERFDYAEG